MPKTLVIGATGTVGAELVRLLQAEGHDVLRATRQPTARGDVRLDLTSGDSLDRAFEGVQRAFLLSPPGHVRQDTVLSPLIDAAARHRLHKVVLMSAMGADADEEGGLRKAERHLERSGLAFNVIRPNWFMQNFNSYWLGPILARNRILLPLGDARGSFIDARDIAAVASRLLTRSDWDGRAFDLTGAQALDHHQVADTLARVSGRPIQYEDISVPDMREQLLGAGLPSDYAEFLLVILGFFKAGYAERTTDAVQQITGRAPRSLQDYASDHRQAWSTRAAA